MSTPRILVADDSEDVAPSVKALRESGYEVETVAENVPAIDRLDNEAFDLVIAKYPRHGDEAGGNADLLEFVAHSYPHVKCIVTARLSTIKESVDALKRGAFDYLARPLVPEEMLKAAGKALLKSRHGGGGSGSGSGGRVKPGKSERRGPIITGIVGESPEIRQVLKAIEKVAHTSSTVLITGESGTGKELIARAVHYNSDRRNAPLIVINCGAIPGELLESELFGHEKGAFTGANRTRIGRFEMADGGTIFLDEIGDMSPNLQVKLLRAVQEQVFERVGGMRSIKVDIRIISATNKDLPTFINDSRFREDLYYRLNVIPIKVPPLRERKADIPLLAGHFLKRSGERLNQTEKTVDADALNCLVQYDWPGNIRELENMMERLSVMVDEEEIRKNDLPDYMLKTSSVGKAYVLSALESGIGFNEAVEQHQKALILQALEKSNWVKAKAAELLKMNRTTLVERIKKLKLDLDKEEQPDDNILNIGESL